MAEANKERIFDEFVELVSVPCHTLKERQVFELLQQKLKDLGFVTQEDDAGKELGGECGNLWGWLPGNKVGAKRVLLTAHMDCVEPCEGIKVVKKDGKILSDGTTILGSDDKSGVVAILEAVRMLQETKELVNGLANQRLTLVYHCHSSLSQYLLATSLHTKKSVYMLARCFQNQLLSNLKETRLS